jgi:phenylpropionate dioxygenase-like ring-hydroxylating dioxygenase large terminal subunit
MMQSNLRARSRASVPIQNAAEGYFQSWYPVALSSEVARGQVISKPLMDGKLAVFRGRNGEPSVVSAYCRHLGADLSGGTVVGDSLRCPYHHWSYDAHGVCNAVPFDKPRRDARLFKFPTVESLGMIWAFNGERPLFDFPGITGFDSCAIAHRVADLGTFPVESWMLTTNTFDIAHLRALHNIEVNVGADAMVEQPHSVSMTTSAVDRNYGSFDTSIVIHGSNLAMIPFARENGELALSLNALAPIGEGMVRYYLVSAVPLKASQRAEDEDIQRQLGELEVFLTKVIEEDRSIMENIRFKDDTLVDADQFIVRYLDWLKRFPRSNASRDYIT